jgi:hypothetical protein
VENAAVPLEYRPFTPALTEKNRWLAKPCLQVLEAMVDGQKLETNESDQVQKNSTLDRKQYVRLVWWSKFAIVYAVGAAVGFIAMKLWNSRGHPCGDELSKI